MRGKGRAAILVLLLAAAVPAVVAWRNTGTRSVIGHQVFRSGQPGRGELERDVAQRGVRTVVNLRGENPGQEWYREEQEGSRQLGLTRWDIRLNVEEAPAQSEVRRLLEALDEAPRPILIHCRAGADRVGFASAFARAVRGDALSDALSELQPWAGHLCWRPSCDLHGFFRDYRRWLAEAHRVHSAEAFRLFVEQIYVPEPYHAEITLAGAPPEGAVLAPGQTITFRARVRNASHTAWPLSAGPRGVRLGARVLGPHAAYPEDAVARFRVFGMPEARDVFRAGLEEGTVAPGATREFEVSWPLPETPGRYVYQIDLVNEHVHWFSDMGGPGVLLRLEVAGPPAR